MGSVIDTPGDGIWTSNGAVEEIEQWCAERAEALERDGARAIVGFMKKKIASSGPGMYGFSVTEPPFDDPTCRKLLARLIDELAHEIQSSATTLIPRWSFLHGSDSPWLYPYWLSVTERIHAGIARSFATNDGLAALALDLDAPLRAAVSHHRWMPIWRDLWRLRRQPGRWERSANPTAELDALDQLIAAERRVAARYRWPSSWDPDLRALLANRADLLEVLGRTAEAAVAWRDVAAEETDASAAAVAREIARRLDPSAT